MSQQMERVDGHNEEIFSPTTATYVELLSAAGLVASAARGEQEQRRTLCTFKTAHALHPKDLDHSQHNVANYEQQQQPDSRSTFPRTTSTPGPRLGPPLKQTSLEVYAYSHNMRNPYDQPLLESPETPRAPITPDALATNSSTYFDSIPIHHSSHILSASHISTSDPLNPSNAILKYRDFPKHPHPPTIFKLARRLAWSPFETSKLSNQELEALEEQFSWLEDAMSEGDDDPFVLDQQFTPKQPVPSRASPRTVDPDDTPRLLPTPRTPPLSSQSTIHQGSTQGIKDHPLSFGQRPRSRSVTSVRSPGPAPDLPLPSVPLHSPALPSQPTTPRAPSRTRPRSKTTIDIPPVPPLPTGVGLGLRTSTKALTCSRSPFQAQKDGAITANSILRNRSHTSGVDRLPSQTKGDITFLVEEDHTIQTSRARAVSGGSGMSRGLMYNQRAEFRKKSATIPVLRYDTDTGGRESDDTSITSTTGSEVELLQGEREGTLKGRKGKRKMW